MNNIFLSLRLSLSLFFVFSCQSKSSIVSENFDNTPFITLDLKEEKTYTLDSIHVQSFSFSPLDKNHLIVFSSKGETYDLNVETSEWLNLNTKWGKYAAGLRQENFHPDPFQPNYIWIANFNNGLIAYNHSTHAYIEFPHIKPVSTIAFTESAVWIGTWRGLYIYDRSQLTMKLIDKVAEIYIRSITPMGSGQVGINKEFIYDQKTNTLEKGLVYGETIKELIPYPNLLASNYNNERIYITTDDSVLLVSYPLSVRDQIQFEREAIWIPSDNELIRLDIKTLQSDTIQIGWPFFVVHSAVDSQYFWIANSVEALAIDKMSHEIFIWQLPLHTHRILDYQDTKYFYAREDHSIIITPKSQITSLLVPLKPLTTEEDEFNRLLDSTKVSNQGSVRSLYRDFKLLESRFNHTTNPRIKQSLEKMKASIIFFMPHWYPPFDHSLITWIDSIREPDIKGSFAAGLIVIAAQKGMIETAVSIDTQYVSQLGDRDRQYYTSSVREIHSTYRQLQKLKSLDLNPDDSLWRLGSIYYDLFSKIGPFTEASGVNMEYPFSFLTELLEKFPESDLADNAAYIILKHDEGSSHEGGDTDYNPEAITLYKQLLVKYPETELRPEIYQKIIELNSSYGTEYQERKKYLDEAKNYVHKFNTEFPNHPLRKEIEQQEEWINYELKDLEWELDIASEFPFNRINAPVLVHFTLKNKSRTAKTISIYKSNQYSNFYTRVHPEYNPDGSQKKIEYTIHPELVKSEKKDSIIQPGATYRESRDITKWVKEFSYGKQGYYQFIQTGKYQLKSSFPLERHNVPSNKIEIVIIE